MSLTVHGRPFTFVKFQPFLSLLIDCTCQYGSGLNYCTEVSINVQKSYKLTPSIALWLHLVARKKLHGSIIILKWSAINGCI